MMMSNKVKFRVYMIIGVVTLSLACALTAGLLIAYLKADQEWIGASIGSLGNIIGGVIGGIVAYLAAAFQVEKALHAENIKQEIRMKNLSLLVQEELQHNHRIFTALVHAGAFNPEKAKEQLSFQSWETFKQEGALALPTDKFARISGLYRKLKLAQYSKQNELDVPRMQSLQTEIKECELLLKDINFDAL